MAKFALKYFGGKQRFAKWILSHFPAPFCYSVYCEPFCGTFAVGAMLNSVRCNANPSTFIANDKDCHLINLLRAIKDNCESLCIELSGVPYNAEIFAKAKRGEYTRNAVNEYILLRMSRNGDRKNFAQCYRTRRSMNEGTSKWLSGIEALPGLSKQLQGIVLENCDAITCIQQHDCRSTFFYVDPPYLHVTRGSVDNYRHEMTIADHTLLLRCLGACEAKVMLSGYVSELYRDELETNGKWRREDLLTVSAAGSGDKKKQRVESLWMNY